MSKLLSQFFKRGKDLPKYSGRGEEFKYWQRYVERLKDDHVNVKIFKPLVGFKYIKRRTNWYHNENRPWSMEGLVQNRLRTYTPKVLVEPIKEWKFFIGDRVEVLVGKDKGKIGEICEIVKERNWCFVEELHMSINKNSANASMDTRLQEMPLLVNEITLIDPSDMKATDIDWRYTEEGERVRVSVRSGRIVPLPYSHLSTWEDFTKSANYQVCDKDTADEELTKITFEPTKSSFEEDICSQMGLKHEKRKQRSFWY